MRVLVLVKTGTDCAANPTPEQLATMKKYNDELIKAGVFVAVEGLQPSAKGARVKFDGFMRTVTDGPFPETKELIGGFWIWEVRSVGEAVEWLKKAPFEHAELEIRPIFEEFGAMLAPTVQGKTVSASSPRQ
jgi:hypothetical protein